MSKSGLHAGTTQRLIAHGMGTIDTIIECTVSGGYSHAWALQRVELQVYQQHDFKVLPKWARAAIANYFSGKVDMINRHLTFTGCMYSGGLFRAPGSKLGTHIQPWSMLRAEGIKVPDDCDEAGQYWPSGAPFSTQRNTGPHGLNYVARVAEPA